MTYSRLDSGGYLGAGSQPMRSVAEQRLPEYVRDQLDRQRAAHRDFLQSGAYRQMPGCLGQTTKPDNPFTELKHGLDSVEGFNLDSLVCRCNFIRERYRVFFIGNGGSAAIASHMAADWAKNGRFSALSFNDPAALTCFANDLGYADVFTNQLKLHARAGDILFAISSSGQSANIRTAVTWAQEHGVHTVTLSGFRSDNPLRQLGRDNIYVPSSRYGVVEITHLACLHALLDELVQK